jgi:hypothetical protein
MTAQTLYHAVRDFAFAGMLVTILIRQEKTVSQVDDLNTEVAEVVADEAKIKADITTAITLLQAGTPDISGALALLTTLHGSLQSDDSELEAAEAPPTPPATS